jgi:hypothetical protein
MDINTLFKRIRDRFKKNYREGPLPKYISIIQFWLDRILIWDKARPSKIPERLRSYKNKYGNSWVILDYTRICDPARMPIPINEYYYVLPDTFKMHCQVLNREFNVISLPALIEYFENDEEPPDGTVAVTITNGHADAYLHATKYLLDYSIPASWVFPIAYIESNALLLEDMIATASQMLEYHKKPILRPDGFLDPEWKLLESRLKNGIATPEFAGTLYTLLLAKAPRIRTQILIQMSRLLESLPSGIPLYEDFMKWSDIIALSESNFDMFPGVYSHSILSELSKSGLASEIHKSKEAFNTLGLSWHSTIGLPHHLYDDAVLDSLAQMDIKWCLGGEFAPPVQHQTSQTKVINRTLIFQNSSFSREFFIAQMLKFNK